MDTPRIAETRPAKRRLEAGRTVYWCRCGRSRQQPFCDGSHAGTDFEPLAFTPEQGDEYFFCQCKRTARPPFCDGSHKRIGQDELDAQAGFRTTWYRLAGVDELSAGSLCAVRAGGRELILTCIGERYAALDARCPHRGGPLAEAALVRDAAGRDRLRCPWHGSDFDPLSGRPAAGQGPAVPSYPVEVRADGIYVALREPLAPQATLAELLVDTLRNWGLRQVFATPGEHAATLAAAFRQPADADEVGWLELSEPLAAAVAAAVFAELGGQPAACVGTAAMWPGLLEAAALRVPVVAIVERWPGGPPSAGDSEARGPLFAQPAGPDTAFGETIDQLCRTAILQRRPGVLVVPAGQLRRLQAAGQRAGSPAGRVCDAPVAADPDALQRLGRRLQDAARPAVIVGDGAGLSASCLIDLAERLGAPVLSSRACKGLVPEVHPLSAGVLGRGGTPVAAACLRAADLLLLFGGCPVELAGLDWLAPLIQVHPEPQQLGAVVPFAQALQADPGRVASWLARHLPPATANGEWLSTVAAARAAWQRRKAQRVAQADDRCLDPVRLFDRLSELLPADALVIVDLGAGNAEFSRYFECRQQRILLPASDELRPFGMPAAIAAWLATQRLSRLEGRPVIGLSSQDRFLPQLAHFLTAVRQGMGMTQLVFAEPGWPPAAHAGRRPAPAPVALANWAESCGATGWRVSTMAELAAALQTPAASERPFLVDIAGDAAQD